MASFYVQAVAVDTYSEALGRRYSDLARLAMKEQRSVAAGAGLGRGGTFDEPLKLLRVFGSLERPQPPERKPGGLVLTLVPSGAQRFAEEIARLIEAPHLPRLFDPEARSGQDRLIPLSIRASNEGVARLEGTASLDLPKGWTAGDTQKRIEIEAGGSVALAWSIRAPEEGVAAFAQATVAVRGRAEGLELARMGIVLRRSVSAATPSGKLSEARP